MFPTFARIVLEAASVIAGLGSFLALVACFVPGIH